MEVAGVRFLAQCKTLAVKRGDNTLVTYRD